MSLRSPASDPQRPAFAFGAALAVGLAAGVAQAAGAGCVVRVVPPGHPTWEQAARDASARSSKHPSPGGCASAVVEVQDGGAQLVFTTRDGRRAVRRLAHPDELAPTLEALRITGNVAARPAKADADTPAPVARDRSPAPGPTPQPVAAEHAGVHFGASAGARLGTHKLVTPVFDAFGSLSLERWELGIFGQWESGYHEIGDEVAPGRRSSGFAAGVTVGRREPAGSLFSLLGGAQLGLAALDEETAEHNPAQGRAEARVGAYLGAVLPRRGETHLCARLVGEIVPNHIGQTPENAQGEPLMPWWATTLTVGVELGRQ